MPEPVLVRPNPFYPHLFEPGNIGRLRVKNRIVMPPMGSQFGSDTGAPTERTVRHYARRAAGGAGLIIVEFTCVDTPGGKGQSAQLALDDDRLIASHAALAEAVHQAGAKVSIQLHHAGGNTSPNRTGGIQPVAPALIPSRAAPEQPRVLKGGEIPGLVEKFSLAVRRAQIAGYDSVELHGAHGYLISEFMSPYINNRADEWGGNLENRMRFPLSVIRRAKELVGGDFPITMRFSGVEHVPGGRQLEETLEVARILEAAGLAALHISASVDTDFDWAVDPMSAPQGRKVYLAAAVKQAVRIPVIAVGVIREPAYAESVIAEGKADFVAIGRGLLADPDWANKAREGRADAIRKCFSCNYCDGVKNRASQGIRCVVNPELGLGDAAWEVEPAARKKKVMVVGGGPAGIEAARVAALRGHDVTLFEKRPELGGQLRIGAKVPGKDKLNWLIDDLLAGLNGTGVTVKCGAEVTAETVAALSPDVIVLATGGEPLIPDIPGAGGANVVTAWALIDGGAPKPAKRYAVIGGNSTGCEAALLLAHGAPDVHVTLIEQLEELAPDMEPFARQATLRELAGAASVETHLGWKVTAVTPAGAEAVLGDGPGRLFEADLVVLAAGVRPHDRLLDRLRGVEAEVFTIGDCTGPGTIAEAVADGRIMGASV